MMISGSRMVDSSTQASQALSSNRDVACMGDFVDDNFNDTGFDSDVGSGMEFEWNTRNDTYAWESVKFPPDSVTAFPARSVKEVVVQHMGREKTLSAALQLQHDAGLILSNVHVLQQLVTALHGASANVMGTVRGRQPFPTHAMQQALLLAEFAGRPIT